MVGLLLAFIFAATVGILAFSRARGDERPLILAGFLAHLAGAASIVVYHRYVYGGGDMLVYHKVGSEVARVVETDSRYLGDVFKLLFHQENDLRLDLLNLDGSSSGSMCALAALFIYVAGDNLYALCIFVSAFSYLGQVAAYRAAATHVSAVERRPLLTAFMLLPSVVFWSSGFIKEAFVIGFLGLTLHGLLGALSRVRPYGAFSVVVGLVGIALLKPYILFPLVLALSSWFYAARSRQGHISFVYKVIGVAVAVGGLVLASRIFPQFGVDQLGRTVSLQQHNYRLIAAGGSNVDIGDAGDFDEAAPPTLARQLKYFPLALVNALVRPVLFEARNVSQLLGGLEMTVIVVLVIAIFRRATLRQIVREVASRPVLLFAFTFILSFSTAVGLSTANLGTMSRYRIPAMPMYVGLLLVLRARFTASAAVPTRPAPATPALRAVLAARQRRAR